MKRFIQSMFFSLAALAISAISLAAGDLKITFNTEAKMLVTVKATEVHHYTEKFFLARNEKDKMDILTDYTTFTQYTINHKKKTIEKITVDDMIELMDRMAGQGGLGGGGDDNPSISVEKAGTETVADRNCEKWRVSLGKTNFIISVDPALLPPVPQVSLEKASQLASSAFIMVNKHLPKLYDEMAKIKGMALKTESQIALGPITVKGVSVATAIEEGPLPASLFELPSGYKETDQGKKLLDELSKKKK